MSDSDRVSQKLVRFDPSFLRSCALRSRDVFKPFTEIKDKPLYRGLNAAKTNGPESGANKITDQTVEYGKPEEKTRPIAAGYSGPCL